MKQAPHFAKHVLHLGNAAVVAHKSTVSMTAIMTSPTILATTCVTLAVEVSYYAIKYFKGELTGKMFFKRLGICAIGSLSSVAGSAGGAFIGAWLGGILGSVIPGAGTITGAWLGGIIGSIAAGIVSGFCARKGAEAVMDQVIDDSEELNKLEQMKIYN